MVTSPQKKRSSNAIERAISNSLTPDVSWRQLLELYLAKPSDHNSNTYIELDPDVELRALAGTPGLLMSDNVLEKHTFVVRNKKTSEVVRRFAIVRPAGRLKPSDMSIDQIELFTDMIIAEARKDYLCENQRHVKDVFTPEKIDQLARFAAGDDHAPDSGIIEHEIQKLRRELWPPEEVFGSLDEFEGMLCSVALDANDQIISSEPSTTEASLLNNSEWDFTSPEEIDACGGPGCDLAYAFRLRRLCAAVRATAGNTDASYSLCIQLGALAKEWEHWRQFDELLTAGFQIRAEKAAYATRKSRKLWMNRVRDDFESGRIGDNASDYARKIQRDRRLEPPGVERIKNFISELRSTPPNAYTVTEAKHP